MNQLQVSMPIYFLFAYQMCTLRTYHIYSVLPNQTVFQLLAHNGRVVVLTEIRSSLTASPIFSESRGLCAHRYSSRSRSSIDVFRTFHPQNRNPSWIPRKMSHTSGIHIYHVCSKSKARTKCAREIAYFVCERTGVHFLPLLFIWRFIMHNCDPVQWTACKMIHESNPKK